MANSPVDTNPKIMEEEFGTRYLITDPRADRILDRTNREDPSQKKFKNFCGGRGGWDDFCERMGE